MKKQKVITPSGRKAVVRVGKRVVCPECGSRRFRYVKEQLGIHRCQNCGLNY